VPIPTQEGIQLNPFPLYPETTIAWPLPSPLSLFCNVFHISDSNLLPQASLNKSPLLDKMFSNPSSLDHLHLSFKDQLSLPLLQIAVYLLYPFFPVTNTGSYAHSHYSIYYTVCHFNLLSIFLLACKFLVFGNCILFELSVLSIANCHTRIVS
jgi:hypothetical protein